MTSVKIETVDTNDRAALLHWYPSENAPQPVDLCLDLEDGELSFRVNPEISNAVPRRHRNGIVQTWTLLALTPHAANELLDAARDIAQRILDDSEIVWDGENNVGRLGGNAQAAHDEIDALVEQIREDADDPAAGIVVNACGADDYFTDSDVNAAVLAESGLTADTTDTELDDIADRLAADALAASDTVVVRIAEWLQQEREEMRDAVNEELAEVVETLEGLEGRRNEMIRRVAGHGRSLRDIAATVHCSHQTVANIIKERP